MALILRRLQNTSDRYWLVEGKQQPTHTCNSLWSKLFVTKSTNWRKLAVIAQKKRSNKSTILNLVPASPHHHDISKIKRLLNESKSD